MHDETIIHQKRYMLKNELKNYLYIRNLKYSHLIPIFDYTISINLVFSTPGPAHTFKRILCIENPVLNRVFKISNSQI